MIQRAFGKQVSILITVLPILLAGCSYNQYGFPGTISSKTVETPCARVTTLKAYGIHIHTNPGMGIQCGVIDREMVFPVLYNADDRSGWAAWTAVSKVPPKTDPGQPQYHDTPIHISTHRKGIGVDISAYSFSIILGLSHKRLIRAESTDSFIFYYNNMNPLMHDTCGVIAVENKGGEDETHGF